MPNIEQAISIALAAHKGQRDKANAPYILHPLRLMHQCSTPEEMIVALLHDVVEDSELELADLQKMGFSSKVISAVDCLTKRACESYDSFIARVCLNKLATSIKIKDIEDNMNLNRLENISDKDIERLKKYHNALKILKEI